jgi:RNA polymerase sigma-70 factor (ECF subfamily)
MDRFEAPGPNPEQAAAASEATRLIESLVESLPDGSRAVFMLRDVEGMTTTETADALNITEENVKIRLHRARAMLRQGLSAYATRETGRAFAFHASRCDRVVAGVFERIEAL